MAARGMCVIPGCVKPIDIPSRGWCRFHYNRWHKYGDPEAKVGRMSPAGTCLRWLEAHVDHEGDGCLIWPFGLHRNGYTGNVQIAGKRILSTRWMCERRHGPPPTPKHHAAHLCNNGRGACVHPGHLVWKTNLENEADKLIFGTLLMGEQHPRAKLTEQNVLDIMALRGKMRTIDIAMMFNVSDAQISNIHHGRQWNWLTGLPKKR